MLLGVFEEAADAGGTDTDEHLDELGGRNAEEWHAGLAGNGARQQRLTRARWANQQHTLGHPAAELLELLRIAEEIDHLLQLELGLLHPGHVMEGGLGGARLLHAGAAAAETENALRRLAAPSDKPDPDRDQHQERQEREQQASKATGVLLDDGRDIFTLQQGKEGRIGQPDVVRHGGAELGVRDPVAGK